MPDSSHRLTPPVILAMIACCAAWGGNTVAVKAVVPSIPAAGCAALRFVISLPMIAVVCRGLGQPLGVPRKLWGLVGLHGLLTFAQIGTFNIGTDLGLAGRSSVFINIHPLIVTPLAWAFLGEHLGTRGLMGLGAAAAGVAVLVGPKLTGGGEVRGDLIVIGSAVIFGVQTVFQKWTFPRIPPATLLFLQTVAALPMFLVYSAAVEGFGSYRFTRPAVVGILFQGLIVSGLCFSMWMVLLRRYPAGQIATFAFLTPLFGVGFGSLLRGETLTWELLAGGALVGLGIYLAASAGGRERPGGKILGEDRLSAIPIGDDAL